MATLDRRGLVTVDFCVCPVLGIELRASHVVGKHSSTVPHFQHRVGHIVTLTQLNAVRKEESLGIDRQPECLPHGIEHRM